MGKKEKGLREFRREWIEMTKGMDDEERALLWTKYVGKAYWYAPSGIWHIVEITDDIPDAGEKFVIRSVKELNGKTKEINPWYILRAVEIDKKEIPTCDKQGVIERCYQLIWDNWKEYLNKEISRGDRLSKAVEQAKFNITKKFCPYYEETYAWKIWEAALDDLSRKMHPTYIPVNSEGKILWDSVDA
jgi:hypothetical protein